MLGETQRFANRGSIDADTISQIDSVRSLSELIKSLRDKDFGTMRKWVALNSDLDMSTIFRTIYNGLSTYLKPESVPQAVVILAKYQYQSAFVVDQEINMVACLTEIMVETECK